jgi:hypothetical protein
MLPYFAGYALMAVIFNVSVVEVLIFLLRLSDLIVLMVYFSATLNLRRMLGDCQALKTNKHTAMVFYLFIAIAVFIRRFRQFYQHSAFAAKNSKSSPGSYISSIFSILPALVEAITINWQNREQVEAISSRIYSRHYQSFPLLTRANVSGCVLITLLILVISL